MQPAELFVEIIQTGGNPGHATTALIGFVGDVDGLGDRLDIEVEARDPEGEALSFWWPEAPPGFSSDPSAPRASWEVPEDYWLTSIDLSLIALDGAQPPASEALLIPVMVLGFEGDTGLAR